MTRRRETTGHPRTDGLLAQILGDVGRDPLPFAHPVVSWSDHDDGEYLASIEACALEAIRLERRGREHGDLAELDPARTPIRRRFPKPGTRSFARLLAERWHASRPIVLPGIAVDAVRRHADAIAEAARTHERLGEKGGLSDWIAERAARLAPHFVVRPERERLVDPERDVERVAFTAIPPAGSASPVRDLWCKSAWLSTHADDRSMRIRFGHGKEGVDDGDRDLLHHRLVAELASRLLPEIAAAAANPPLTAIVESLAGESVLFTQALAYWNAPGGGALFHHDAFAEDAADGGEFRQLGVAYVQLSGATAWLAVSTDDLVSRLREYADALEQGEQPWVRAQLFEMKGAPFVGGWRRFRELVADDDRVRRELAQPGAGALGPLVDRGPEFTAFLADAGHAAILRAGDAILLPNHGLLSTCMHSVFCVGDDVAYSVSLAMRPDREAPEVALEEEARRRDRREAEVRRRAERATRRNAARRPRP